MELWTEQVWRPSAPVRLKARRARSAVVQLAVQLARRVTHGGRDHGTKGDQQREARALPVVMVRSNDGAPMPNAKKGAPPVARREPGNETEGADDRSA